VLAFFVISFGKFGEGQPKRTGALPLHPESACAIRFPACPLHLQSYRILSRRQISFSAWPLRIASTNHASSVFLSRNLPGIEPFSGSKLAKLNRQIQEVEHLATYRKQRAANSSNRQNIQKCHLDISSISQVAE
jgi:hypothetical protein